MQSLDLLLTFLFLCPIVPVFSGAGECRTRTLQCYDCDSRDDPQNETTCLNVDRNPNTQKPKTRECHGCCVKFYHDFPDKDPYVVRTCTEMIEINYFMVDHVCLREGKDRGKMCFCEDNLCNPAPPTVPAPPSILSSVLLLQSLRSAFS